VKTVSGEFYAGHKAEEIPRFALIDGRRLEVCEILARKRVFDSRTGKVTDFFTCRLEDGRIVSVAAPTPCAPVPDRPK
jgi:hypothetical protein